MTNSNTAIMHHPRSVTLYYKAVYSFQCTCVVLCFQMQIIQFVNVADVHLFFVQLCFVEVLAGAGDDSMKKHERKTENISRETIITIREGI